MIEGGKLHFFLLVLTNILILRVKLVKLILIQWLNTSYLNQDLKLCFIKYIFEKSVLHAYCEPDIVHSFVA